MAEDERYRTNSARVDNRDSLIPPLVDSMKTRTSAEWTAGLIEAKMPHGPINTIEQAFAEPQAIHRGLSHAIDGIPQVASQLRLGESPMDGASPPPALGQDTGAVLAERLGLSTEERRALRERGTI